MNYIIKGFYDSAVNETKDYHKKNPELDQDDLNEYCADKFAKLLIEECVHLCNGVLYDYYENDPGFEEWHSINEAEVILDYFGLSLSGQKQIAEDTEWVYDRDESLGEPRE
jgi:hypothetical protein